jgi:hypothetical protein
MLPPYTKPHLSFADQLALLMQRPFEAPQVVHIGTDFKRRSRVYGAAAAASYLIKRINVGTTWAGRMKDHWLAFPGMPFASATHGGFLLGWDQEAIWT